MGTLSEELLKKVIIKGTEDLVGRQLIPRDNPDDRAIASIDLELAMERLGLDEKLKQIQPDVDRCKLAMAYDNNSKYSALVDHDSLKRVIEFIECLDEP